MNVADALKEAEARQQAGDSLDALQTLAGALTDHPEAQSFTSPPAAP